MSDDFEELRPAAVGQNIQEWNLEDLQEYITNLEAEIERCRKVISQKQALGLAADALFKK